MTLSPETRGKLLALGAIAAEIRPKRWWQFWRSRQEAFAPRRSDPEPTPINWDAMRGRPVK